MKTHKGFFRLQCYILNLILIFLIKSACLICLSQVRPVLGIDRIQLKGVWEGTIITSFKTEVASVPVRARFDNGRVTLETNGLQTGSYSIRGRTVTVTFYDGENDPFTLVGVELTSKELKAQVRFKNDIPNVTSVLSLSKVQNATSDGSGTRNIASGLSQHVQSCSGVTLTPELAQIFAKYQMVCPFSIEKHTRWYNVQFTEKFLTELLRAGMGRDVSFMTHHPGMTVSVTSQRIAAVKQFLKPLISDSNNIVVTSKRIVNEYGGINFYYPGNLKPEFVKNSHIDLDRVWVKVVNIANRFGISLDGKTEVRGKNSREIRQTIPRKVGEADGFLYFETVKVAANSTTDGPVRFDPDIPVETLSVEVVSEIFKRKGFSSKRLRVDCNIAGPSCTESSYLEAVSATLKRRDK